MTPGSTASQSQAILAHVVVELAEPAVILARRTYGLIVGVDSGGLVRLEQGCELRAGPAEDLSVGLDAEHGFSGSIEIVSSLISAGQADLVFGLRADGVTTVSLGAAEVSGHPEAGDSNTSSTGVELVDTLGLGGLAATITGSTITGGGSGFRRTGVRSEGVSLSISGSDVSGSREAGEAYSFGVLIEGVFAPGSSVELRDNVALVGGHDSAHQGFCTYNAAGIKVDADQAITVEGNTLIKGTAVPLMNGGAAGILLLDGNGHLISDNVHIEGGPTDSFCATAGIALYGPANERMAIEISGNALIGGNMEPDLDHATYQVFGIYALGVDLVLRDNALISAGSWDGSSGGDVAGVFLREPTNTVGNDDYENYLVAYGNHIAGGGGTGMHLDSNRADVHHNLIEACGLEEPADCGGYGLWSFGDWGSHYHNNYVFGGLNEGAIACALGSNSEGYKPMNVRFEYNLCHAAGRVQSSPHYGSTAVGLVIDSFWNQDGGQPIVVNNILDAGTEATTRYALLYRTLADMTFSNNDLLVGELDQEHAICLAKYWPASLPCAKTIAEVEGLFPPTSTAENLVSILPGYAAPDPNDPSAAGFHLDGSCALRDLGQVSPAVSVDYDGDARGTGSGDGWPEIGPDECP